MSSWQPIESAPKPHEWADEKNPATAEAIELLEMVTARAAYFSRKSADDLYGCLLETTQDYLIDNARFNIGERIASAERQARHDREAWGKAEARARVLLEVLVLILPLAKGYASANRVGSNDDYVAKAEAVIAREEGWS